MSATGAPSEGPESSHALTHYLSRVMNTTCRSEETVPLPRGLLSSVKFGVLKTVSNRTKFDVRIYILFAWASDEARAHLLIPLLGSQEEHRHPMYVPMEARLGVRLNTGEVDEEVGFTEASPSSSPFRTASARETMNILDCGQMKESMTLLLT